RRRSPGAPPARPTRPHPSTPHSRAHHRDTVTPSCRWPPPPRDRRRTHSLRSHNPQVKHADQIPCEPTYHTSTSRKPTPRKANPMTTHGPSKGGAPASLLHLLDRTLSDPTRTANAKELLIVASRSAACLATAIGLVLLPAIVTLYGILRLSGIGQTLWW